ncbi:hypothetical protein B0J12DRAFT_134904 [Macrophomina phaseolina]|uniref:Uncharacterized protein n=1 Tax=Macrophomina phaseolina TaxID=35725 RepID=A0ABQ8G6U4_9PEZI|nr:hypothetical protein B0J12DRAFT_134904 [Macrophomina phaseolina]
MPAQLAVAHMAHVDGRARECLGLILAGLMDRGVTNEARRHNGWLAAHGTASVPFRCCLLGRTDPRSSLQRSFGTDGAWKGSLKAAGGRQKQLERVPIRCGWALALRERLTEHEQNEAEKRSAMAMGSDGRVRTHRTPFGGAKTKRCGDVRFELGEGERCCDTLWAGGGRRGQVDDGTWEHGASDSGGAWFDWQPDAGRTAHRRGQGPAGTNTLRAPPAPWSRAPRRPASLFGRWHDVKAAGTLRCHDPDLGGRSPRPPDERGAAAAVISAGRAALIAAT